MSSINPATISEEQFDSLLRFFQVFSNESRLKIIGHHASSAMQAVALLISMDKGIEELAECVHPHPSITEGIQECVRVLLGKSLFKPDALKGKLSCRTSKQGLYEDIHF